MAGVQTLKIGKRAFVLLPAADYRRLEHLAGWGQRDAVNFATESIGRDLHRKRRAAGLSQAELAEKAGIRAETLSRLENGRGNPTVATVKKILYALGERV